MLGRAEITLQTCQRPITTEDCSLPTSVPCETRRLFLWDAAYSPGSTESNKIVFCASLREIFWLGPSASVDKESIMSAIFDRISVDPEIMNGQPCIRNMRLTVRRVVESVAIYPNWDELKQEYPELEKEDIRQALQFAAGNLYDQTLALEAA
jgi:uncharacterized protein (DUF433 family)